MKARTAMKPHNNPEFCKAVKCVQHTQPTHTPTPFLTATRAGARYSFGAHAFIIRGGGQQLAVTYDEKFKDEIVRAVNSHEELLKVAKAYDAYMVGKWGLDYQGEQDVKQAIAKAEGR
jgi:hypothetical protein